MEIPRQARDDSAAGNDGVAMYAKLPGLLPLGGEISSCISVLI